MAIEFRNVRFPPFENLSIAAPDGAVIGVLGGEGSGTSALLQLSAGIERPLAGEVVAGSSRRYLAISDFLDLQPTGLLLIDHTFARAAALVRAQAAVQLDRLRAGGTTVLIASHEQALLRSMCDEVWWFDAGQLSARGDPGEVLDAYNQSIAASFCGWGETLSIPIAPALRKGDGRAEIVSLETIGAAGKASAVLNSGEDVTVRVVVRFCEAVENPVIGMLIRTRIGLEVYGTNTELEKVGIGPIAAGETVRVDFRFRCDLCPNQYTLTAASHDPDGTAHDWIDDAVAFQVADSRYTAGVANLRAGVTVSRVGAVLD